MRSSDGIAARCQFPSYSWVGWIGKVFYPSWNHNLRSHLDLIFYYLDANRLLKRVVATAGANQSLAEMSVRKDGEMTIVTAEDITDSTERARASSIDSNILFFWSSTAPLLVKPRERPSHFLLAMAASPMMGQCGPWIHSGSIRLRYLNILSRIQHS